MVCEEEIYHFLCKSYLLSCHVSVVFYMLFLWTTTKHGKIWLDGEEFKQIVSKRLPKSYYCQEIAFVGEKNLIGEIIRQKVLLNMSDEIPHGIAVEVDKISQR